MNERRSDSRYRAVELTIALLFDDGERAVKTHDIGEGGVCFTHDAPLPVGEFRRLRLMLDLGQERFSEPLELQARVAWCTELEPGAGTYQVGAAFGIIGTAQRQALKQLLYLMSREVSEDEHGRMRFRTALVPTVDPVE